MSGVDALGVYRHRDDDLARVLAALDDPANAIERYRLVDGQYVGVRRMLFTWALLYGLDADGQAGRYCFEYRTDAIGALEALTHALGGTAPHPIGPWIKRAGGDGDVANPNVGPDFYAHVHDDET